MTLFGQRAGGFDDNDQLLQEILSFALDSGLVPDEGPLPPVK